jgi:hypothetical protein
MESAAADGMLGTHAEEGLRPGGALRERNNKETNGFERAIAPTRLRFFQSKRKRPDFLLAS